ncbi:hypothetical protein [Bradyrhizobium sp.]|uniref:hypothetical protein n=1 Tax=Bradyrhizobium sp. TaxID=376 RepID=UPI0026365A8D|nr:hypothetical protein [Bradyrhizobium sp.]
MKQALLAMTIMVAAVLLSWFVQGVRRRKGQDHASAHDGSVSVEAAGSCWFDGQGHSGDHGGTSDGGGSDGGGAHGGGGDSD